MPVTKTATKALRKSKARAEFNRPVRSRVKTNLDVAEKNRTVEAVSSAFSAIDRAVKHHLIHRNKAARLKSRAAKLLK